MLYSLSVFITGLFSYRRRPKEQATFSGSKPLPKISIILPVKNEESVIKRCFDSLTTLKYQKDYYEVIVVEDGSIDKTREICSEYSLKYPGLIRFFRKETSNGKPSALNFALSKATGDVVGVFDADCVPSPDMLSKVALEFNKGADAVQGMPMAINKGDDFWTRLLAHETDAWFKAYMFGRDRLGLFLPLSGSCQFIRRSILEQLKGWKENTLTEDMELSLRIARSSIFLHYRPEISAKQEVPSSLRAFLIQRLRWFRDGQNSYPRPFSRSRTSRFSMEWLPFWGRS